MSNPHLFYKYYTFFRPSELFVAWFPKSVPKPSAIFVKYRDFEDYIKKASYFRWTIKNTQREAHSWLLDQDEKFEYSEMINVLPEHYNERLCEEEYPWDIHKVFP